MFGVEVGRWCLLELLGSAVARTSHRAISNSSFSKTWIMPWLSFKDFDSCPSVKDKLSLKSQLFPTCTLSPKLPTLCWHQYTNYPWCANDSTSLYFRLTRLFYKRMYNTSSQMGSLPNISLKKEIGWNFAGSPVVKTSPRGFDLIQWIWSLVGELRSHMPWDQKTKI